MVYRMQKALMDQKMHTSVSRLRINRGFPCNGIYVTIASLITYGNLRGLYKLPHKIWINIMNIYEA